MKGRGSSFPFHSPGSISYFYSTSYFHVYIMMNRLERERVSLDTFTSFFSLFLSFFFAYCSFSFCYLSKSIPFQTLFTEMSVLDLLYTHNDCVRHVTVLSRTDLLLELSYHVRLITFLFPLSLSLFPLFLSFPLYSSHSLKILFLPHLHHTIIISFFHQ